MVEDIKKLQNDVDSIKDDLSAYYHQIMATKHEK